jgi:prepilin-type N-terminal cleavage/methylation domain-containing protein
MAGRLKSGGFTLIEVLVVMAIISVLMGFGIGMYQSLSALGKATQARNTIIETMQAVKNTSLKLDAALVVDPQGNLVYGLQFATVASCNFEPPIDPEADPGIIQGLSYKSGRNNGGELQAFPFGHTGGGIGFPVGGEVNFANFADYDLREGVTIDIWVYPMANRTADLVRKGESYGLRLRRGSGAPVVEGFLNLGEITNAQGVVGAGKERFDTGTYQLKLNRWNGIRMKYDRNSISLSVDAYGRGLVERFVKREENRPIRPDLDADLIVGSDTFSGRMDDFKLYGILAGATRRLPSDVAIEGDEVRTIFFSGGKLDPRHHSAPETIVLIYEGVPRPITIGLLGSIDK